MPHPTRRALLLLALWTAALPTSALGQVGVTVGNEYGFGLVARLGGPGAVLEVGAGMQPLFVVGERDLPAATGEDTKPKFIEAVPSFGVGAKLRIWQPPSRDEDGLAVELGPSYSSFVGWGVSGGVEAANEHWTASGGVTAYFGGKQDLLAEVSERRGQPASELEVDLIPPFQLYVSLAWYPF